MRLFVAVPVDEPIKKKMIQLQQHIQVGREKVRWCTPDQLHLTLKFLGEVPDDRVTPVTQVMHQAVQGVAPFEIEIGGIGCFPPGGSVRIIWVGGSDPSGSMSTVVQRLESGLADLGFKKETRTFSIHFTIGRVKSDHSRGTLRNAVQDGTFDPRRQSVNQLILYESQLSPQGARYSALARVNMDV